MLKLRLLTYFSTHRYLWLILFVGLLSLNTMNNSAFRVEQKKFPRVRQAYANTLKNLKKEIDSAGFKSDNFKLILTANKFKEKLYVYLGDNLSSKFTHFKTYDFCVLSGDLGPKRKEGDNQVPEGFYYISHFNPKSNFHLSLKVNYPNNSDKILANKKSPGGEIYIHGNCVSVGCIPITDAKIEELYVLCVEATTHGQTQIPVYIFPFSMDEEGMKEAEKKHGGDSTKFSFWKNIQLGYDKWKSNNSVLKYSINAKGSYTFK